ncbi:Transferase [Trema orientale]|uniref:Transferase n=1 Tax=Trema orientale TaxID=63057 RepID=A0A2P5E8P7_TREOI|nr:Transferase [Trema orientale]
MAPLPPHAALYFYRYPHSTPHFLQTHLPNLKRSLSLTLRHFFPFAGKLVLPPPPAKPHILFTAGDSVTLTVAESSAEFNRLFADNDGPRAAEELHPFVPKLPLPRREGDASVAPLLALQVCVFPNSGICIGVRFSHVAADGRAFHHFMKSWAFICKERGDRSRVHENESLPPLLPCHDRAAVEDPDGLEPVFLNEWWSLASTWDKDAGPADTVRTTFVLGQAQIERLKRWATEQFANDNDSTSLRHATSFVVTCGLIWVCLTKSQEFGESNTNIISNDSDPYYFIFVADCRNRLKFRIPTTYFGNCLSICFVSVKRKELLGENGIFEAIKAIGKRVAELERGALVGAEKWMLKWKEVAELWKHVTVAGSPKLGFYDSDFGWGRPKRTESVQIDVSGAFSLAENGDEKGGVEVGLALSTRAKMSYFKAILEQSLKLI